MADFNRYQNGVFGEVKLNSNQAENTSFFEGTISEAGVNNNASAKNENVFGFKPIENAGNVFENNSFGSFNNGANFEPIKKDKAITKQGLWSKVRAFLFQEIDLNAPVKVELTPYQQKVEDEINEFLHQEITFKGIANFFKGKK